MTKEERIKAAEELADKHYGNTPGDRCKNIFKHGYLKGAEAEAKSKWVSFDTDKPKVGLSVLISFISTLNDKRVYKVDELMKDGTFRFTTRTDGIIWQHISPPLNQQ